MKYCLSTRYTNLSIDESDFEVSTEYRPKTKNYLIKNINELVYTKINQVIPELNGITDTTIPLILLQFNRNINIELNKLISICNTYEENKTKPIRSNKISDLVENGIFILERANCNNKQGLKKYLIRIGLIDSNNVVKSHYLIEQLLCKYKTNDSNLTVDLKNQILNNTINIDSTIIKDNNIIDINELYKVFKLITPSDKRAIKYFLLDFGYLSYYNNCYYATDDFKQLINKTSNTETKTELVVSDSYVNELINLKILRFKNELETTCKRELVKEIENEIMSDIKIQIQQMIDDNIKTLQYQLLKDLPQLQIQHTEQIEDSDASEPEPEQPEPEPEPEQKPKQKPRTFTEMINEIDGVNDEIETINLSEHEQQNTTTQQYGCVIC